MIHQAYLVFICIILFLSDLLSAETEVEDESLQSVWAAQSEFHMSRWPLHSATTHEDITFDVPSTEIYLFNNIFSQKELGHVLSLKRQTDEVSDDQDQWNLCLL